MFTNSTPETFWLDITNIVLGAVTVISCLVVGFILVQEIIVRVRSTAAQAVRLDDHAFVAHDLGITMADGGERIEEKKEAAAPSTEKTKKQKS